MEERRTAFDDRGLALGATRLDLFAAEIHYWRLEPAVWPACLAAIRSLGFELVSTCAPWSVHEGARGRRDFAGRRDSQAFLDLCQAHGLFAIVRPGPRVGAELTGAGLPDWIVRDAACQARTARGTPMWSAAPPRMAPLPSYAAPGFQAAAGDWLDAVGELVGPRRFPDGAVVAIGIDDPIAMRGAGFDGDHHPSALAWWAEQAGDRAPPAVGDRDALEWLRFQEIYTTRALAWLSERLDAGGCAGLARYTEGSVDARFAPLPGLAGAVAGTAGLGFAPAPGYAGVRRRALHLSGSAALPFATTVGVGGPAWLPPPNAAAQHAVALGILAAGVRALSFAMVVERERWQGAAISADGEPRPGAAGLRTLLATLRRLDWTGLRRRASVALVASRVEARAAIASSLVAPLPAGLLELLDLGDGGGAELARDPAAARHRRWTAAIERALTAAAVPYDIVDETATDWLAGYRAVVVPTEQRIDGALLAVLRDLAGRGVTVVLGPGRPTRDELDRPLADVSLPARCGLLDGAALGDPDALADALLAVAGDSDADFIADGQPIDCSLFEDPGGAPRALLVGNPAAIAKDAQIAVPAGTRLHDPFGGEPAAANGWVALPAEGVRMFEIEA